MAITEQSVKLNNRAGIKTGLNSRRFLRTNPTRLGTHWIQNSPL